MSWATTALAWVATYLVHSTVLIGAAWAIGRAVKMRPEFASAMWKAALIGGVATATVVVGTGVEPLGGRFSVGASAEVAQVAEPWTAVVGAGDLDAVAWEPMDAVGLEPAVVVTPVVAEAAAAAPPNVVSDPWWPTAVAWTWILGAALMLGRLAGGWVGFTRRLAGRKTVAVGPLWAMLDRLRDRAGFRRSVRLSVTERIAVPLAAGLWRPEICLPGRATRGLGPAHQETMLAHELAHVLRADPAWRLLGSVIEGVLFFQPLNRLATRKIAACAEYLCDDWAARHTRAPVALAECLAEVAGWMVHDRRLPVPAMATRNGSALAQRVRRLLDEPQARPRRRAAKVAVLASCVALIAVVGLVAPSAAGALVGDGDDQGPEDVMLAAPYDGRELAVQPAFEPRAAQQVRPVVEPVHFLSPGEAGEAGERGERARSKKRSRRSRRARRRQADAAVEELEDAVRDVIPSRKELRRLEKAARKAAAVGGASPDEIDAIVREALRDFDDGRSRSRKKSRRGVHVGPDGITIDIDREVARALRDFEALADGDGDVAIVIQSDDGEIRIRRGKVKHKHKHKKKSKKAKKKKKFKFRFRDGDRVYSFDGEDFSALDGGKVDSAELRRRLERAKKLRERAIRQQRDAMRRSQEAMRRGQEAIRRAKRDMKRYKEAGRRHRDAMERHRDALRRQQDALERQRDTHRRQLERQRERERGGASVQELDYQPPKPPPPPKYDPFSI